MNIPNRYSEGGFRLPYRRRDVRAAIAEEFDIDGRSVQFMTDRVYYFNVGNLTIYRMWDTDIVVYDRVGMTVTLNSDGWQTVTTKKYMNQILDDIMPRIYVWQKNFEWFVTLGPDKTLDYEDGMMIHIYTHAVAA